MEIRKLCWEALIEIIYDKKFENIVVNNYIKNECFVGKDKDFFVAIVKGTIQNYLSLTEEIKVYCNHQVKPKLMILLALSYYQLKYLTRTPSYAIINDAVNLAKTLEVHTPRASAFTNAVLHKLNDNIPKEIDVLKNFPAFLLDMFKEQYGFERSKKIFEALSTESRLCCRVNLDKTTREEILKNPEFEATKVSPCGVFYNGSESINDTKEFYHGLITVMDEAAQLVVPLLDLKENDVVIDMCSAPGGKLSHICSVLNDKGTVYAIDNHEHKMELIRKTLRVQEYSSPTVLNCDSRTLSQKFGINKFDKVLLDAPCSGLGVIKRKGDILLNLNDTKFDELEEIQYELLCEAGKILKRGGTLVYSTCTLNKKENEVQIKYYLNKNPDLYLVEQRTILPFEFNSDGFYYAIIKKHE
jgi:16S rRNA (cytosine967-C5)-methyltransferase